MSANKLRQRKAMAAAAAAAEPAAPAAAPKKAKAEKEPESTETPAMAMTRIACQTVAVIAILWQAVDIRLNAVRTYGRVIHEFDPYFNLRATKYLVNNGYTAFSEWYDHGSWYPLGRPVGTTMYPGMQYAAAVIYYYLNACGFEISVNDTCVFIPAFFAVFSCVFVAGIAYEVTGNAQTSLVAMAIMAIIPAHLMRSVAGGFDNESVAVAVMTLTYLLWIRANRNDSAWLFGIPCGIVYVYMVATWGGYVFVLNLIGVHTGILVLWGRYSLNLWKAYSLFFVIGTYGSMSFAYVGNKPLQQMEHLGPLGVFFFLQLWTGLEEYRKKNPMSDKLMNDLRLKAMVGCVVFALFLLACVLPAGFIGPLSARVRGLFLRHSKTGNPLVDSVAEHQATSSSLLWHYFQFTYYIAPGGLVLALMRKPQNNAKIFLIVYYLVSQYFASKMNRLVLILAPAVSICSALAIVSALEWGWKVLEKLYEAQLAELEAASGKKQDKGALKKASLKKKSKKDLNAFSIDNLVAPELHRYVAIAIFVMSFGVAVTFRAHCLRMSHYFSEPQIMKKMQTHSGSVVIIDDYRESFWWLRDNTPLDARVLAWWDYGYQINGIANRTTIADGNTWNHEHIGLLARSLVSPEDEAHQIVRHLADYVWVFTSAHGGSFGDDIAKMPHIARIAGSVYSGIDGLSYYMNREKEPSKAMRKSLLYKLHSHGLKKGIKKPKNYKLVFESEHLWVRIYKNLDVDEDSKEYHSKPIWEREHPYSPPLMKIRRQHKDFDDKNAKFDFEKGI